MKRILRSYSELKCRYSGENPELSKPIGETLIFNLYLGLTAMVLFFSGIWIASAGDIELLNIGLLLGILICGVVIFSLNYLLSMDSLATRLLWVSLAYLGIVLIGREIILQEHQLSIHRLVFNFQFAFVGLAIIQGTALGLLAMVFAQPMLPELDNISDKDKYRLLNLHLTNQWRIGQITLSMIVITITGLLIWTFPRGGHEIAREKLARTAIPLVMALSPVLFYIFRKLFVIEKELSE